MPGLKLIHVRIGSPASLSIHFIVYLKTSFAVHGFSACAVHDDVIKWKHFPRYWPFVRGIHRSPANSPHKGQCRGALMFSLICAWINAWVNNREAGDLSCHRAHYDVIASYNIMHSREKSIVFFITPHVFKLDKSLFSVYARVNFIVTIPSVILDNLISKRSNIHGKPLYEKKKFLKSVVVHCTWECILNEIENWKISTRKCWIRVGFCINAFF